ncbi:hypothetical protein N0V86_000439 [Didymella sp. IMI 355093]|nr:hypothetical protein N0V86_000439 [Didymella sp. IMI 355093]
MAEPAINFSVKQRPAQPAKHSFLALPPKLRNEIYRLYIGKDTVDYVPHWSVFSPHGWLPLAQTCKQVHPEFITLFKAKITVKIRHFHLARYLQKFYPIDNDGATGAARLCLLLPNNWKRPRTLVSYVDLTHLFTLMSQNEKFGCTFAHPSQSHELALGEARELRDLLHQISSRAAAILPSVINVRLVIAKAGWTNSELLTVENDDERPAIWFIFKQHKILPGEWPWYGAHDLNAESVALWQQWLEDNGAAGLQRWNVHVTAHRDGYKVVDETMIQRNATTHTVVSPEKLLHDQMLATGLRRFRL